MSGSDDDPFSRGGKTVIRPNPGGRQPASPPGQPGPAWPSPGQPQPPSSPNWPPADSSPGYNPRVTSGYDSPFDQSSNQMPRGGDDWLRGPIAPPPQQRAAPEPERPKIPLEVALNAPDSVPIASSNPLTAAASPLLILLGRLRLMIIDVQARPLMEKVASQIMEFERNALAAGADQHDVAVAKYALCGTADDIVQNLPGTDTHVWLQYSMVAQFFQRRTSGVGFYTELNRILQNPAQHYNLLELMHACLSLGFEGQYRTAPNGQNDLQRTRRDTYQTLRQLNARSNDDVSVRWRGLDLAMPKLTGRVPIWVLGAIAAALGLALFLLLRFLLAGNADAVTTRLLALSPPVQITLERASYSPLPKEDFRDQTQLERIRAALADDIAAGGMAVEMVGDMIVVRINNLVLFDSGKADVKKDFEPIATRIAAALDKEPGPILVVGHTDNVKVSGTGRFKSNEELSVARADGVKELLATTIADPSRLQVEGRGEFEPIGDNATPEGRAQNRRVEVMISREETLKPL
ncbi:type VI secretion system protein ImpK [Devosia sp. UYZn731]|uniref:type VI secretion system protein TssL, long form n=1 Tax=Devosia sp. UYZn731 TaxID=3156345 RepID=UPI00339AEA92